MSEDGKGHKQTVLSLEGSSPQDVVSFVLCVFKAHYQRKLENVQAQLQAFHKLDCKELETFWIELRKSTSSEDALYIFTNWVEGKLDGDGLSLGIAQDGH
jgi:hypothetical protein